MRISDWSSDVCSSDLKAEIVEAETGDPIRSPRVSIPKPAIIRLVKFVHVPRKFRRQVTNTFLFARDDYRCHYCHRTHTQLRPQGPAERPVGEECVRMCRLRWQPYT